MKVFEKGHWVIKPGADAVPARDAVAAKAPKPAAKRVVDGRWVVDAEPVTVEPEPAARKGRA